MRWALILLALGTCRRPTAPPPSPDAEAEEETVLLRDGGVAVRVPQCERVSEVALQGPEAGHVDGMEVAGAMDAPWLSWQRETSLYLRSPRGIHNSYVTGATEVTAPVVAFEQGTIAMAWAQRRGTVWEHVLVAGEEGRNTREILRQPQGRDDSLGVSVALSRNALFLAWDELGTMTSVIAGQWIARNALNGTVRAERRVWSQIGHEAAEPVLEALPDGGAVLAYVVAQEVAAEVANQASAEIFVRALDPQGHVRGNAVRVTPSVGIRFGVVLLAHANAVWVAYRVAGDADRETRGDGGDVAVVRLSETLVPSEAVVVTADDAVPTGLPVLVRNGDAVEVWWSERQVEGGIRTLRRPIERDGTLRRPSRVEPIAEGNLPLLGANGQVATLRANASVPWLLQRLRCPTIDALPTAR